MRVRLCSKISSATIFLLTICLGKYENEDGFSVNRNKFFKVVGNVFGLLLELVTLSFYFKVPLSRHPSWIRNFSK